MTVRSVLMTPKKTLTAPSHHEQGKDRLQHYNDLNHIDVMNFANNVHVKQLQVVLIFTFLTRFRWY